MSTSRSSSTGPAGVPGARSSSTGTAPRRTRLVLLLALALALVLFAGFMALGTWQVERRAWKHDLIARVTQRVHAPPVAAPARADWPAVSASRDEYRHVRLEGAFLGNRATRVQAVTELGGGYWLLVPLRRPDGSIVLVNRGFVPPDARLPAADATPQPAMVTGLLRLTEPGGGFLRKNDPAADRWFSRDVQAIAARRGLPALGPVAPYFVDADADAVMQPAPGSGTTQPVGGLTVIAFPDNHLVYALTWYALALMVAGATIWLWRGRGWLAAHSATDASSGDPAAS